MWSKRPAYRISENWQNCEPFSKRKKKIIQIIPFQIFTHFTITTKDKRRYASENEEYAAADIQEEQRRPSSIHWKNEQDSVTSPIQ
jgi:hypothetical protein